MALVSIVVPIYKVEKYLSRCVQSLLNQTLKDIEIRNLIHIAEGVRYGLSQERITASLCGLRNNRSERPNE